MGSLKNQAYQSRIYSVYDICVRCFLRRGWQTWNDGGISMMYPFMTLNDDTEVTHSEMKEDGRVKVYIETPDSKGGFHSAVCWLPAHQWTDVHGYTNAEMDYFKQLIRNNAHLIIEFSQDGGVLSATTA